MAFANYGALKAAIADWLNREDLAAQIPDFIRLLEARVNRELRTHDMVKRATAYTDDGYFVVPPNWLETIALMQTSGSGGPLEFVSIARSMELRRATGTPRFYTHMDGKFFLIPAPTGQIYLELIYRAAVPVLAADTDTNWLLARSPDLYLFGALAEAEPYLKNDERVPLWQAKANKIIGDMQIEAERAASPQGKLTAKSRTFG